MFRSWSFIVLIALWIAFACAAAGNGQEKARKGFLSILKEGRFVSLKEVGGKFEITLMEDLKGGPKVVEVGGDYISIEDAAGFTEVRIPIYSIKSVVKVNFPKG